MDIWIVLSFQLLWITVLWTFTYKSWYVFILLGRFLGVELQGYMVNLYLTFIRLCHRKSKQLYHRHSHQQWRKAPISPHSFQHLLLSDFFLIFILVAKCYATIVLICIYLIINNIEILSYVYEPFEYLLLLNVYSDILFIFN